MVEKKTTPFDVVSGKILQRIFDTFYGLVAKDPDLTPIFPNDLSDVILKQKQGMTQYLGGSAVSIEEHGHSIMRAHHFPFSITPTRAMARLSCRSHAMDKVSLEEAVREKFYSQIVMTDQFMFNIPDNEEKFLGEHS